MHRCNPENVLGENKAGFKGEVLNGGQLEALVDGLNANGLLKGTSHLLTGYIGSVSFLRAVLSQLLASPPPPFFLL